MTDEEILSHIDHTLLKAVSSWAEIEKLCTEAIRFKTASVCVPPSYVKPIRSAFGDGLVVCTVIGFPLGYSATEAKLAEVRQALADGCDEFDMVINITWAKNGGAPTLSCLNSPARWKSPTRPNRCPSPAARSGRG